MGNISQQQLDQALRECAAEPIHQIGNIQPHGALLVLSPDSQRIVLQASENLGGFLELPPDGAIGQHLGQPLGTLIDAAASVQIEQLIEMARADKTAVGNVSLAQQKAGPDLLAHVYLSDGMFVLELEHDDVVQPERRVADQWFKARQKLLLAKSDTEIIPYFERIAKLVRTLTDYDRVMVYRFDANLDGEIIIEERAETAPSYLGLHFPASDIPSQARRLYETNLVRVVTDVGATPVPVLPVLNPATGQPLDMTYSALRGLSTIHIEYLRNMGVQASMAISLLQNDRLWGMIVCHHLSAKKVSMATREAAIFVSEMASARLSWIETLEQRKLSEKPNHIVGKLLKLITTEKVATILDQLLPEMQALLDATAIIMVIDGRPHVHGEAPRPDQIDALLAWLATRSSSDVFACDYLAKQFAAAAEYADIAAGALMTPISRSLCNYIVWLRPEKPRTVHWAGNAQKGIVEDSSGSVHLTPRKSFEVWTESWRGRSNQWTPIEIGLATTLALAIPEGLAQKSRLEQANESRRRAEAAMQATQQHLESLTAAVPGVVYQFLKTPGGEWSFPYLSKGVEDLFEVTAEAACRDHNALTRCILPEDRDSHQESVDASAKTLGFWAHEHRIRTRGGKLKWVRGQALPQRSDDGSVLWNGILFDITERKHAEEQLRRSQIMLARTERIAHLGSWEWDVASDRVTWSDEMFRIFQRNPADGPPSFAGHGELYAPEDMRQLSNAVDAAINQGKPYELELRAIRKDGTTRVCLARGQAEREPNKVVTRLFGSCQDITERKQADEALRIVESRFKTMFNQAPLGIAVIGSLSGHIHAMNPMFARIVGRSVEEMVGIDWMRITHPDDVQKGLDNMASLNAQAIPGFQMQKRYLRPDGSVVWVNMTIAPLYVDDEIHPRHLCMIEDITERKAAADQIEYLAFYDSLTGLPNRKLMLDRLRQALASSARHHRHGALIMIDMDNFKSLNDTLGHDAGDQLLMEVASRLKSCIRDVDTAARLGGDEFVVILEDLDESELAAMQAEDVVVKIQTRLCEAYPIDVTPTGDEPAARRHHCTPSIGIALFCDQSVTVDELMKRADTAMYQAKAAGRNTLRFFDPRMQATVKARADMEMELRKAIVEQQFVLHYQPQIDSAGRVIGAESLVRWQHPERGLVPPGDFIPLAEDAGLILPIGHWVQETACRQLAAWATRPEFAHLTLAVNVSARQFSLPNFVDQVLALIEHTGAPPGKLKLELTESLLLKNAEDIIAKMLALKARGVGFSMDDFGTGYSSLTYLRRLPLDQLKIDQSFVRDVLVDSNDAVIAQTVVALGQSLDLAVIAEGVETQGQRDFLAKNGCHAFQGYLFSRPLSLDAFEVYVSSMTQNIV